ncbi:hypothetical protein IU427_23575 [Nocardia beijingensis]|uniref:hypothetical protein n=1 Tax=Nocardia beijingensis TaxID=95162 RepID=UPI00189592A9|nr:hypothetical protein [Nocardia beijingensis]MBF6468143.1 hypothetical protein [Nocardia beijingensis]
MAWFSSLRRRCWSSVTLASTSFFSSCTRQPISSTTTYRRRAIEPVQYSEDTGESFFHLRADFYGH